VREHQLPGTSTPGVQAKRMCHAPRMPSWRDSLSDEAQADVDQLLNEALPFAQQMLDRRGEFYPYAVKMTAGGETGMVAAEPGQGEHPESTDVLAMLYAGLASEREALRAAAAVSDVKIGSPPSDAIRVEIEHREGAALAVFLPYAKKPLGRGVSYGDIRAASGERRIWPP
jgi:hypothetical protein